MNLLLLGPAEVDNLPCRVTGRRAAHVLGVLGKAPGQQLRVGVAGLGSGRATLAACSHDEHEPWIELEELLFDAVEPPLVSLVVALPRPKALSRMIQAAASFGLREIVFINSWRVEKSYWSSARLAPARLATDAWLGAEQGRTCWVPEVRVVERFVAAIEQFAAHPQERKLALHPDASEFLEDLPLRATEPVRVAIGPEGGWIEPELETLRAAGFHLASLGPGVLRSEQAATAALAQLALVRRLGAGQTDP